MREASMDPAAAARRSAFFRWFTGEVRTQVRTLVRRPDGDFCGELAAWLIDAGHVPVPDDVGSPRLAREIAGPTAGVEIPPSGALDVDANADLQTYRKSARPAARARRQNTSPADRPAPGDRPDPQAQTPPPGAASPSIGM